MRALSLSSWSDPTQGVGSHLGLNSVETLQCIALGHLGRVEFWLLENSTFRLDSLQGAGEDRGVLVARAAWLFERLCRVSEMWVGRCRGMAEVRGKQGFPAVMPLLLEASGMEQASWL